MSKSEADRPAPWLPESWVEVERVEDEIVADGVALARAGVCVRTPSGEVVTGSAACRSGAPMARARFEAWERCAVVAATKFPRPTPVLRDRAGRAIGIVPPADVFPESDAPDVWRFARSSGVALHDDWPNACERAWWELVERDRVLRAWLGDIVPTLLDVPVGSSPWSGTSSYSWRVARFGEPAARGGSVEVVGVFGFPLVSDAPLAVGYGARPDLPDAVDAAGREAMQNLAFLWGEEVPAACPLPGPTPLHHVEHLLWSGAHDVIRAWLTHGHARFGRRSAPPLEAPDGFVDLTPSWLDGRARVSKALARDAFPLTFGSDPRFAHLPQALRVHPVP